MSEIGLNPGTRLGPSPFERIESSRLQEKPEALKIEGPDQSSQSFMDTLKMALENVNEAQTSADKVARDFAAGKGGSLHGVMIAMEKADLSLRTVMAVRNKVLESYQEVMRMQV